MMFQTTQLSFMWLYSAYAVILKKVIWYYFCIKHLFQQKDLMASGSPLAVPSNEKRPHQSLCLRELHIFCPWVMPTNDVMLIVFIQHCKLITVNDIIISSHILSQHIIHTFHKLKMQWNPFKTTPINQWTQRGVFLCVCVWVMSLHFSFMKSNIFSNLYTLHVVIVLMIFFFFHLKGTKQSGKVKVGHCIVLWHMHIHHFPPCATGKQSQLDRLNVRLASLTPNHLFLLCDYVQVQRLTGIDDRMTLTLRTNKSTDTAFVKSESNLLRMLSVASQNVFVLEWTAEYYIDCL